MKFKVELETVKTVYERKIVTVEGKNEGEALNNAKQCFFEDEQILETETVNEYQMDVRTEGPRIVKENRDVFSS